MSFRNFKNQWKNSLCTIVNKFYNKLDNTADWLIKKRLSANVLTLIGLGFAVLGVNFISMSQYFSGLLCLIGNRVCDILDGQIARKKQITTFGTFLDMFVDSASASLFILGFIFAQSQNNAAAGAFFLAMVLLSALALISLSSVSGLDYQSLNQSKMRICAWGAVQNFDHFIALILMCIFPSYFLILAIFFGLIALGKTLLIVSGAYYTLVIMRKGKNL